MNRIEKVRESVDHVLLNMADATERRCGYLHLYGVAQACAMIAMKRKEDPELAIIAGMLHDIYSYSTMDTADHAQKGSVMAKKILQSLNIFTEDEIDTICMAIYNHSSKDIKHSSFDEVLKDADVLQHYLYNPLLEISEQKKSRCENLKLEFAM